MQGYKNTHSFYTPDKFTVLKIILTFCICLFMTTACKLKGHESNGIDSSLNAKIPPVMPDSGWISLFDGSSLKGWHTYGKKEAGKAWNVDNGSIHLQPGAKNGYQTAGGGDLVSEDEFGNFDLKLEWKIAKKANSGIMIFVQEDTAKYKETWYTGPEMQVCDPDSNEDAHSYKHEAGDIYDLIASKRMSANPVPEWNQVEIISNQGRLDLYLNDVHIISTGLWDDSWKKLIANSKFKDMPDFGSFHSGHIALQDHGEEVWYRNIRVHKI
jgi:hypothetical protein